MKTHFKYTDERANNIIVGVNMILAGIIIYLLTSVSFSAYTALGMIVLVITVEVSLLHLASKLKMKDFEIKVTSEYLGFTVAGLPGRIYWVDVKSIDTTKTGNLVINRDNAPPLEIIAGLKNFTKLKDCIRVYASQAGVICNL